MTISYLVSLVLNVHESDILKTDYYLGACFVDAGGFLVFDGGHTNQTIYH